MNQPIIDLNDSRRFLVEFQDNEEAIALWERAITEWKSGRRVTEDTKVSYL